MKTIGTQEEKEYLCCRINTKTMKNYLISEAIGDIAGSTAGRTAIVVLNITKSGERSTLHTPRRKITL